ncbi:flavoprotein oxidoreductase [Helicobacter pylori]|uniref:flavoprotein oxidoreductase n=1 Tax=Helicobacter pylori TaxID=210 RepID=UPI000B2FF4CA|nr:flavoprotein oxidoreductase [Helicobacter pylori]
MDSIKALFLALVILKNNRYYTIRKPLACICKNTHALRHKLKETLCIDAILHHSCTTHASFMRVAQNILS